MKRVLFFVMVSFFCGKVFAMSQEHLDNDLRFAARLAYFSDILFLLGCGANPNAQDECGNTALHYAVTCYIGSLPYFGNEYVIEILLNAGANPNIQNAFGHTPMNMYIKDEDLVLPCNIVLIKALLRGGGDPFIINKAGRSPYGRIKSINQEYDSEVISLLMLMGNKKFNVTT